RARLELRVELAGDEPRMVGQLDDLHEPPLLERAAYDEARLHEPRPIVVVDLLSVPVPLVDDGLTVGLRDARSPRPLPRVAAGPLRAAGILDLLLLRQQVDDRVWRLRVHVGRVRPLEPDHVARELRDRDVHSEADAEVRNPVLPRDAAGEDLAFPAARAE